MERRDFFFRASLPLLSESRNAEDGEHPAACHTPPVRFFVLMYSLPPLSLSLSFSFSLLFLLTLSLSLSKGVALPSCSVVCLLSVCCLCSFDILRTSRGPFVCDVNGFSFVKSNVKYYDDCSSIIRLYFLKKLADRCARSALHSTVPSNATLLRKQQQSLEHYLAQQQRRCPHGGTALGDLFWLPPGDGSGMLSPPIDGDSTRTTTRMARCLCMALESEEETTDGVEEELRTVVVVMRHGDRRPKQKLKFLSTQPLLLQYFSEQTQRKELKLKSPEELRDLLDRNTEIITALVRLLPAAQQCRSCCYNCCCCCYCCCYWGGCWNSCINKGSSKRLSACCVSLSLSLCFIARCPIFLRLSCVMN